jgi:hypothetical protein
MSCKICLTHPIINDHLPPVFHQRYAIYLDESKPVEERFQALEVCLRASLLSLVYMVDKESKAHGQTSTSI